MATYEERFAEIETELGLVSKAALTKLDLHTDYIHQIKERLGTIDTRLGTMDHRLNWMDMHLSAVVDDTQQTNLKLDAMNLRLNHLETVLNEHTKHFDQVETVLNGHTKRLDQLETVLNGHTKVLAEHTKHFDHLETVLNGHTKLLAQILERLPEKP